MVTPLEALKQKYMKDPDIIPAEGEDKEPIAEAMAKQQVRQRENNDRAFELLTKAGSNEVDSGSSGGAKEGGDAAMYRLTEYVQKPVEKNTELDRKIWGKPKEKHLKIINRPFEIIDKEDADKISLDPPPVFGSEEHETEIENLKSLKKLLDEEAVLERIEKQDEDLLFPFNKYLRDNDLEIDREEFMKIMRDVNTLIFKFKYFFNRPRPHQFSDLDEIDNKGGKSPSYPSGHSTTGAVIAEVLSEQFPEHSENFRVMGTELGYNRIIAGLHHMSDHLAGLQLASQIIPLIIDVKITKSDEFMNELFKYMKHREELFKDMTQIGTQDILDGVRIDKESNPRVPRKKGQPAKSKKHSDLYTDEDPKGTIQGLGFKDDKTAKASVKKIKNSNRTHAHKIQAAVAMEQRAKAAGKSSEAGIYRKYIDSMKEKTKRLEKHSEEHHGVEHVAEEKPFSMEAAKESLNEQLEQIQNKLITGDYDIKKSDDIFLLKQDYDVTKLLTEAEFKKLKSSEEDYAKYVNDVKKVVDNAMSQIPSNKIITNVVKDSIQKFTLEELSSVDTYSKYKSAWENPTRGIGSFFKSVEKLNQGEGRFLNRPDFNIDIVPPEAIEPDTKGTEPLSDADAENERQKALRPSGYQSLEGGIVDTMAPIQLRDRPEYDSGNSGNLWYLHKKNTGYTNRKSDDMVSIYDVLTQVDTPTKSNWRVKKFGTDTFVDSTPEAYFDSAKEQEKYFAREGDTEAQIKERMYGSAGEGGDYTTGRKGDVSRQSFNRNIQLHVVGHNDGDRETDRSYKYEVQLPNGDIHSFDMGKDGLELANIGFGVRDKSDDGRISASAHLRGKVPAQQKKEVGKFWASDSKSLIRQDMQPPEQPKAEEAPAPETPAEEPATEEPATEEAPAEQPATEETSAQEAPAETETTTPDFEVLGVMTEAGVVAGTDFKAAENKLMTAVLKDSDGQIRVASQDRITGKFKPTSGFSAYGYGELEDDGSFTQGTMPVHANREYQMGLASSPIDMNQLDSMADDLRNQAVNKQQLTRGKYKTDFKQGAFRGADEANAYNDWIKETAEKAGGEWSLPAAHQAQIDNPSASANEYSKNVQESLLAEARESTQPQQETVETPPEQPVQPVQEQAPAEQPTVEQPAETAVQEPVTTPETPVEQPVDDRQSLINQASESGLLAYVHEQKHGKDNPYTTVETTAAELLDKHKTPDKLRNFLGEQHPKFTKFTEQQKADAQKLVDETTAQQQAAEAQAQAPNPQEIAQNIANEVNDMPTLFQRDKQGNITPTPTASNANMADRYRRLRKLMDLHGGVDEAETGLKNSVQAELDRISPNIKQKIESDLIGMRDNLPVGIKRKLAEEHSRADYHEDSHKAEITAARQQSAAKEAQHKSEMDKVHKNRLNDDLFKGDAHDAHQTLHNHTDNEEAKFQQSLKEKYGNPDSPDFKEGGHTKSDEAAERRAQRIPPPRPSNVPADHMYHFGSAHWVTPDYMKTHPDIGTGMTKGDVVTGLYNLKNSKNQQSFIPHDRAAQNLNLAAIKGNKGQGLGGSDLIFTNQKVARNEHGHIDHEANVNYHADNEGAKHANQKNHYVEKHLEEGKDRVKTDSKTGRVLTSDAGNTALQRYGARLKDAGGFTGALQRFRAAVLPQSVGGGLTSEQAAQYSSTSFTDED